MQGKIMLVDGNSIINRAFYALPVLSNKDGEYTNAVYGFLNIFFKMYDEEKPDYVAVAFDLPKPTFRHEKYGAYKGNRKSMPDELRPQLPLLKQLLKKMNIPVYELEGYEADDILGTLTTKADRLGLMPVVVSGDRDLLQLASDRIKIKIPKTKAGKTEVEDYYSKDVMEKIGVNPIEYIDVKALMGDASDNIPGVPGIGEKTAIKLIQEYKSIENAIANADVIKPKKASEALSSQGHMAVLSKELATIITDVPLELSIPENAAVSMFNEESLTEVKRLEFKSHIARFSAGMISATAEEDQAEPEIDNYIVITNEADAAVYINNMPRNGIAAYAFVCSGTDIYGVSFKTAESPVVFMQVSDSFGLDAMMNVCRLFFESDVEKISLDSKKDMNLAGRFGIEIKNIIFDGLLCGYILNSSDSGYDYACIARDFLEESYAAEEEIFGKGRNKKADVPNGELVKYACIQPDIIFRAYPVMDECISANGQRDLYYNMELPLARVLYDMERTGIKADRCALIEYGQNLDAHIGQITGDIYELTGEQFNINSPIQLGVVLFEKLGLKGTKKTKQGYSTAADVLEKLYDKHPVIPKIIEYRMYTKLKSTYVDGLLSVINEKTGKIHSTFNQTVTSTGRISSTEPNLQNIPVRLAMGRELRKVFVPSDDDFVFLDGDYSQIELRVLAHISGDDTLINAFKEGQDIHRLTASQVFKTSFDEVTPEQRSNAKAVNFGIVYGISAYSLSQDLGIPVWEAEKYIEGYFEKYPKVKEYLDDVIKTAKKDGYASTIFNRRRAIPELHSSNHNERSFGERVAMNMPIQGSAADIIKIAMVNVYNRLRENGLCSRIILQVHDELLLEVKRNELDTVKTLLKEEMEHAVELSVPMETDFHTGENWYEAK